MLTKNEMEVKMSDLFEKKILSDVAAIREFFSSGIHGRKVEIIEFTELPPKDRKELGELCRVELKN